MGAKGALREIVQMAPGKGDMKINHNVHVHGVVAN